jgi:hypothetical protein
MSGKAKDSHGKWRDPDDAPEITQRWVDSASLYRGKKVIRRGRRPAETRKVPKTLSAKAEPR